MALGGGEVFLIFTLHHVFHVKSTNFSSLSLHKPPRRPHHNSLKKLHKYLISLTTSPSATFSLNTPSYLSFLFTQNTTSKQDFPLTSSHTSTSPQTTNISQHLSSTCKFLHSKLFIDTPSIFSPPKQLLSSAPNNYSPF